MAVTDPGELERGSLSVSASEPVDDQQDRLNELEAEQSNEKFRENELSRSGSIVKISVQHQSQTIEDPHKIHTPPEEQVLCVSNLATQVLQETNGQGEQEECGELFEIDLNREENRQIQPEEGAQMFMNYRCEEPVVSISIPVEPSQQFRGFADAPPKLSFASKRMKEYFESFKAHGSETVRVYQFFKSTRTELVACLLFTLITSQALITCRTQQLGSASTWPLKLQMPETQGKMGDNSGVKLSIGISTLVGRQQSMLADLAGGLVTSFTVASLTQVFGHISGCHLIPAVSLALYVKGHISRARLGSYLVAQSVGSILGVSMLSLLTSSQLTAREYREFLSTFEKRQHEPSSGQYQTASTMQTVAKQSNQRRRKRREASEDINLSDVQGSETILLSIMEQQENDRRQRGRQLERRNLEGKTITADVGGLQEGPLPMEATFGVEGGNAGLQSAQRQSLGATRTIESRSKLPPETRPLVNDKSRAHNDPTRALENSTDAGPWNGESGQRSRVQRRKRTRRQQQQQQIQVQDTGTGIGPVNETQLDSGHYLNLLEFSLPLPIMASESIRQCIDKQQQQQAKGGSQPSGQTMAQLASQSFNQCLLLSNSSQMFIFQLLATSLIVLTYLVNVDPRRTDLGFKSLSIGLAYFVASALTVSRADQRKWRAILLGYQNKRPINQPIAPQLTTNQRAPFHSPRSFRLGPFNFSSNRAASMAIRSICYS